MDFKKVKSPHNTVTRDMSKLSEPTGNIYETVRVIGKRSNQISQEMKRELQKKLEEFANMGDASEEILENREQIEISRFYEKLPKAVLIATQEYEDGKLHHKNPAKEKENLFK